MRCLRSRGWQQKEDVERDDHADIDATSEEASDSKEVAAVPASALLSTSSASKNGFPTAPVLSKHNTGLTFTQMVSEARYDSMQPMNPDANEAIDRLPFYNIHSASRPIGNGLENRGDMNLQTDNMSGFFLGAGTIGHPDDAYLGWSGDATYLSYQLDRSTDRSQYVTPVAPMADQPLNPFVFQGRNEVIVGDDSIDSISVAGGRFHQP